MASEAENVTVADLPDTGKINVTNDNNTFSLNRKGNASYSFVDKVPGIDGKNENDLQVSVVSSTDINIDSLQGLAFSSEVPNGHEKHGGMQFGCHICGKMLSNHQTLQDHLDIHNASRRYSCHTCDKSYAWRTSLIEHVRNSECCSTPKPVIESHTRNIVNGSFQVASNVSDDACIADATAVKGYDFLRGRSRKDVVTSHCCVTDNEQELVDGVEAIKTKKQASRSSSACSREEESFLYPCVDCGKPFRDEDLMWKHFETTHCILEQSPLTNVTTVNPKQSLKRHKYPTCQKSFPSVNLLGEHVASHNDLKRFACPICNKEFSWKSSVKKHIRQTSCGYLMQNNTLPLVQKQALNKVAKALSNKIEKEQQKERSVETVFHRISSPSNNSHTTKINKTSDSIKSSPNMSLGEARSLIEINKYAVIVEKYVRNSMLYDEGFGVKEGMAAYVDVGNAPEVGSHECKLCSKVYKYKSSLKLHLRDHTGEIPYQCKICKERFASQKSCRNHIIKHGRESGDVELECALKVATKRKAVRRAKEKITGDKQKGGMRSSSLRSNTNEASSSVDSIDTIQAEDSSSHTASRDEVENENNRSMGLHVSETRRKSHEFTEILRTSPSIMDDFPVTDRNKSSRKRRKRTVKYFDLGESSDDEFVVKRKRKSLNKIVTESLGIVEQLDKETSFINGKHTERRGGREADKDYDVAEEEGSQCDSNVNTLRKKVNSSKWRNHGIERSPSEGQDLDEKKDVSKKSKLLFQCKICDTKFSSRFVLRRHEVITGHAKASYECPYCKRIYSEGGAYSNHMFVHQRQNGMNCDICGKELLSRTTFLNHQEMHRKNPFTCKLCFEWFPSNEKLQGHIATSHDAQKEFKCKYCQKTFDWQSNYTRHMNKHTKKKEFKCKICHYSFNIISNLKRHMVSVHKGETELETSTWEAINPAQVDHVLNRQHQRRDLWQVKSEDEDDSSSPGKRRGRLKALKAVNRKKYTCDMCGFLCSSRVELTNHLRFAHQENNNPATALIHFVIEDENFVCQLCGSVIYIRHSLKNHMRRVHQMDVTDNDIAGVRKVGSSAGKDNAKESRTKDNNAKDATIRQDVLSKSYSAHGRPKGSKNGDNYTKRSSASCKSPPKNKDLPRNVVKKCKDMIASCTVTKSEESMKESSQKSVVSRANATEECTSNSNLLIDSDHVDWMDCSLCKGRFQSKQLLVQHLRNFHKIPAGLEDALIELTKDVTGIENQTHHAGNESQHSDKNHTKSGKTTAKKKPARKAKDQRSKKHVCPICNSSFETVSILESHAAVCDSFMIK